MAPLFEVRPVPSALLDVLFAVAAPTHLGRRHFESLVAWITCFLWVRAHPCRPRLQYLQYLAVCRHSGKAA